MCIALSELNGAPRTSGVYNFFKKLRKHDNFYRTVARKSLTGELYVCVWGLDILRFDTKTSYLLCFICQCGEARSFVWGAKPTKRPVATGLNF